MTSAEEMKTHQFFGSRRRSSEEHLLFTRYDPGVEHEVYVQTPFMHLPEPFSKLQTCPAADQEQDQHEGRDITASLRLRTYRRHSLPGRSSC